MDQFRNKLIEEIRKKTDSNLQIEPHDVTKNNGMVLHGIAFKGKNNVCPVLYIDSLFEAYKTNTSIPMDFIADLILMEYRAALEQADVSCTQLDGILDYKTAKHHLCIKLVNTEKNRDMLKDIPHVDILDLSATFLYLVSADSRTVKSSTVTNQILDMWGIPVDTLYRDAFISSQKSMPYSLTAIDDTLGELAENLGQNIDEIPKSPIPMYILTNREKINGASCMLYPMILEDFASTCQSDLYIIPSSIHEVLILPTEKNTSCDTDAILEMISMINENEVADDDVLSDSLYCYDRGRKQLSILSHSKKENQTCLPA